MTSSLPQIPALDDTFGALVIGTFLGLILYGISLNQIYAYFGSYANDKLGLKLLVATILVLETLYTITTAHICYHYLIINYFNPANLVVSVWSLNLIPVETGLLAFVTQCFYARRLFLVGRQYWPIVLIVIAILLVELGFYTAATYIAWTSGSFAILTDIEWMLTCGTSLALAADTILAGMLVKVLRDSRTGITKTDTMLNVIIMYTVNTGLLTSIFALVSVVLAVKYPHNLWNAITGFPNIRLYSNCMLAALNARKSLVERGMGVHTSISGAPSQPSISLRVFSFQRRAVETKNVDSSNGAQQTQDDVFRNRSLPAFSAVKYDH
ncbi:uncharacterized protein BXZ73DRAFT_99383 [Epithele typhae]|uniref:uncharacterized protein n=1 Tax=Epithele typhae TaxID=378194 RepID=UPI0020082AF3|nr:uncharacterized protein BXZ73DRAFT_99383 [Epithele typhae]KAH9939751.1 hypothetical protein BXZ73DRAFT_99383 [Epithele typhae]